ncbi:hypothetical protein ACLMPP_08575 [Yersinia enterocolitica]
MEEKKGGEAICVLAATCPEGMQRRGAIKSDCVGYERSADIEDTVE